MSLGALWLLHHGKARELVIDEYTRWLRSRPCAICWAKPPSEVHHWPTRGSLGYIDDLRAMPLCRIDHLLAGGERVVHEGRVLTPHTQKAQDRALLATQAYALLHLPIETLEAILEARRAQQERCPPFPF